MKILQRSAAARALASLSVLAGATSLSGCDPGYGIKGTVSHADPSLAGHVLVVTVYRESSLGADGYPVPGDNAPPALALAKRVDGSESSFQWSTLGCDQNVHVVAWVDADDSEKLEELVPEGKTFDSSGEQTEVAAKLAAARPGPGDWEAISIEMDFDHQSVACDPDQATISLALGPRS